MKVLVLIALALATASAGIVPQVVPLVPRDMPAVAPIQGRITNGLDAKVGQFPYQVGLSFTYSSGSWWCGGSIISNQWVITAAHCTNGAVGVTIYYGALERTVAQLILTVSRDNFVQHADYDPSILNNDISLIKTSVVQFDTFINKIALPSLSDSTNMFVGEMAIASGWGRTTDANTYIADILQYEIFEVISVSTCQITYGVPYVSERNICINTPDMKSTCNGDSGGPLVLVDGQKLIGVTSFGASSGCQLGYPTAFTRVTSYLQWIKDNSGVV